MGRSSGAITETERTNERTQGPENDREKQFKVPTAPLYPEMGHRDTEQALQRALNQKPTSHDSVPFRVANYFIWVRKLRRSFVGTNDKSAPRISTN